MRLSFPTLNAVSIAHQRGSYSEISQRGRQKPFSLQERMRAEKRTSQQRRELQQDSIQSIGTGVKGNG